MIAVFYDPASGRIEQTMQAAEASVEAMIRARPDLSALPVDEARDDYDATHLVVDGVLTPKEA